MGEHVAPASTAPALSLQCLAVIELSPSRQSGTKTRLGCWVGAGYARRGTPGSAAPAARWRPPRKRPLLAALWALSLGQTARGAGAELPTHRVDRPSQQ